MTGVECRKRLKIDRSTLTNWENGKHQPGGKNYKKIVRFLGFDPLSPATAQKARKVSAN
jgi:transcriptional regulator with XRE-family HTH domain